MVKTSVIMLMLLVGQDGEVTKAILPFENFDRCYRSAARPVDSTRFVYSERVCIDESVYNSLTLPRKSDVGHTFVKPATKDTLVK